MTSDNWRCNQKKRLWNNNIYAKFNQINCIEEEKVNA